MPEVYIIAAVRTPLIADASHLQFNPSTIDLSAAVLSEVLRRGRLSPDKVDDVVWACRPTPEMTAVASIRLAMQQAGIPCHAPAVIVDRHNGASHQAIHSAAQAILSGDQDLVIAGGSDILPASLPILDLPGHWLADPQPGFHAQRLAEKWNLTRTSLDRYVLTSADRLRRAEEKGFLKGQLVVLNPSNGYALSSDQALPNPWTHESLASLPPLFKSAGVVTCAHLSPPVAGAAAVLLASPRAVGRLNLTPLALLAARSAAAADFSMGLAGSIPATAQVMKRADMTLADMDFAMIEESSASCVLAWIERWQADIERVNPHGGALAQGWLPTAGGALLITRLFYTLGLRKGRFGLAVSSTPDGMGLATVIERL
jgi:acetyl-CoA acetyltransferase family protein